MKQYYFEDGVTEAGLRERLLGSNRLLVVCTKAPTRHAGNMRGGWQVFALNKETDKWARLSLSRIDKGVMKPRTFVSPEGIVGFITSLDMPVAVVPVREGDAYEISASGGVVDSPGAFAERSRGG